MAGLWLVALLPALSAGQSRAELEKVLRRRVLPNGLEQTFTLAHRPAAAGDLVVRGAVTTSLWTPAVEEQVGALGGELRTAVGLERERVTRDLIEPSGDRVFCL